MKSNNKILKLTIPYFLKKNFIFNKYYQANINDLFVGLLSISSRNPVYKSIFETPHYTFAKKTIFGINLKDTSEYKSYKHYSMINAHACSEKKFIKLIENIVENSYDWENKPILVFKNWRRPLPLNRLDVADGFHRLAILAALDQKLIKVGLLKYKHDILTRLKKNIYTSNN